MKVPGEVTIDDELALLCNLHKLGISIQKFPGESLLTVWLNIMHYKLFCIDSGRDKWNGVVFVKKVLNSILNELLRGTDSKRSQFGLEWMVPGRCNAIYKNWGWSALKPGFIRVRTRRQEVPTCWHGQQQSKKESNYGQDIPKKYEQRYFGKVDKYWERRWVFNWFHRRKVKGATVLFSHPCHAGWMNLSLWKQHWVIENGMTLDVFFPCECRYMSRLEHVWKWEDVCYELV